MTNEDLVALIRAGERERLPELWAGVERFVWQQARRRAYALEGYGGVTAEDLYQCGYLAMVKAVDGYDSAKGMPFIGWLAIHLKNAFAEAAGYRGKKRDALDFSIGLNEPLPVTEDLTMEDILGDPMAFWDFEDSEHRIWRQQLCAVMEKAFQYLTEDQRTVLQLRYWQGLTLEQTGRRMNVSKGKTHSIEQKALRVLRHPVNRELEQFVESRTPYYSGTGLGAFKRYGSQPERMVILREKTAEQFQAENGRKTNCSQISSQT